MLFHLSRPWGSDNGVRPRNPRNILFLKCYNSHDFDSQIDRTQTFVPYTISVIAVVLANKAYRSFQPILFPSFIDENYNLYVQQRFDEMEAKINDLRDQIEAIKAEKSRLEKENEVESEVISY